MKNSMIKKYKVENKTFNDDVETPKKLNRKQPESSAFEEQKQYLQGSKNGYLAKVQALSSNTDQERKVIDVMKQLGDLDFLDFDKQLPYANAFNENLERLIELLTGEKMTESENYVFRVQSKAFSPELKSNLLALGSMNFTNLDKNLKVLTAKENQKKSIDELIGLLF